MIIARDRRQCRVIFGYVRALLTEVPLLAQQIERETADSFDLAGSVTIEVQTASYKAVRGYAIVAALCDELAFWPTDDAAADPDYAVIDALRPGMAQFPGSMLLCASSPYAKRGALHDAYKRFFGRDGRVLVWKAATRMMNPTVPQHIIDAATERDASDARAEWLAEFRDDLENFISRETVEACVDVGIRERPPAAGRHYFSFTDPSGGSADSMTCAIGHLDGDRVVLDCLREICAPFDPESATDEIVRLLLRYGCRMTNGDRYAAAWVTTAFEKRGISYLHCELPRSSLYLNLLPHVNSKTIRLLDIPRAVHQIAALERRTGRGARDIIDHPPNQHDDCANAIAGLVYAVAQQPRVPCAIMTSWSGNYTRPKSRLELEVEASIPPCTIVFPPEPVEPPGGGFRASRMNINSK
jgi:hypothetical protein